MLVNPSLSSAFMTQIVEWRNVPLDRSNPSLSVEEFHKMPSEPILLGSAVAFAGMAVVATIESLVHAIFFAAVCAIEDVRPGTISPDRLRVEQDRLGSAACSVVWAVSSFAKNFHTPRLLSQEEEIRKTMRDYIPLSFLSHMTNGS